MTEVEPEVSAGVCYRHPDRQSWILCQRCGRTICPQCQTQAAVGVHCPECVRESRESAPRTTPRIVTSLRSGGQPVVTYALIAVCVIVYLAQWVIGDQLTLALLYYPPFTATAPWTMLTSVFAHGSLIHVGLNMLSLYLIGPAVEQLLGRARYLVLFLVAGFAGSVAVDLVAHGTPVYGASGAIFGLLGAYFIIARKFGGNTGQLVTVIVLNLAIGFFVPGIAWQAHVGGLIGGAVVALIFLSTRNMRQRNLQIAGVVGFVALLIVITVARSLQ